MSLAGKRISPILSQFLAAGSILVACTIPGHAQALTVRFSILSLAKPATVRVEGSYPQGSSVWSFRNTYGGVVGLGERIQGLSLLDANGVPIQARRVGPGEFKAEGSATRFSFDIRLAEPADPGDAAHVSGLNLQYGYLMLADILPTLHASRVRVDFQLPQLWSVASSATKEPGGVYQVPEPADAVFFVGRDLREERRRIAATDFTLVTAGEWPFSGGELMTIATKILNDHRRHVGFDRKGKAVLMLAPFPGSFGVERWTAETRGSNVVLLLGRNASRSALLGQLGVVLSHELLHLWVPNALTLDGDYDWFFEGFTLYQALRAAVRLGFVSFQEYLDTLARVYDSYLATAERDRFSLVEASVRRWTVAPSLVYDKGVLIAFCYDLRLRRASQSRRSLDDVYQELFRSYAPGADRADGNEAIIKVLNKLDGDEQFSREYIQNPGSINLESLLPDYGMRLNHAGGQPQLLIDGRVDKEQRELLGSLGYRKARG